MNWVAVGIAALVAISVVPTGGATPENEPPLADAGLDQHADVGETVLLDANGSRDPDGTIASYEWNIETPNGTTMEPQDPSDPRTRFVVNEPGRYDVTIVVTDDDGAERADTLYVDVTANDGSDPTFDKPGGNTDLKIILDEYGEKGTTRVEDPNHYTDSVGMGKSGLQVWMPDPNAETGTIEGVLFGRESYRAAKGTVSGRAAGINVYIFKNNYTAPKYSKGASTAKTVGYESVTIRGKGRDSLENYESVDVTINVAEGQGLLDTVGVSDYVTREDYESTRDVVKTATTASIEVSQNVVNKTVQTASRKISTAANLATNTGQSIENTFESVTTLGSPTSMVSSKTRSARVVP